MIIQTGFGPALRLQDGRLLPLRKALNYAPPAPEAWRQVAVLIGRLYARRGWTLVDGR